MKKLLLFLATLPLCSCSNVVKYDKIHFVSTNQCLRIVERHQDTYKLQYPNGKSEVVAMNINKANYILVEEGKTCPLCGVK